MRARCNCVTDSDYAGYGGRGISVDAEWDEFPNFFRDMGPRPEGGSIDRIDVNGNYGPDNCRWADKYEQANNRRSNHLIEWNGEKKTLQQWCNEIGIEPSKVRYRLKVGFPLDKAFSLIDHRKP